MKLSIHKKITILFSAITVFSFTICFLFLSHNITIKTYENIELNLNKQLLLFKTFYKHKNETTDIDYLAREFAKTTNSRVTIINNDGTVISDSQKTKTNVSKMDNHKYRPEIIDAINKKTGKSIRYSSSIKTKMLYMAIPYNNFIIRLSVPLSEINEINKETLKIIFIALIISIFSASILGWFVYRIISTPIKQLSVIANNISKGEHNTSIAIDSNDEIGDLSKSISKMSKEIYQRIEDVKNSKSRLEAVFQSMFDGILILDNEGNIIVINESLKEILGITTDVVNKNIIEIIRNIDINEMFNNIINNKTKFDTREISLIMPIEKDLMVNASPIIRHKQAIGTAFIFHDITQRKKLEQVRQDFVANVSHELRTPIASIVGYAETLKDGAINDKDAANEFVETIHNDAKRLTNLVNDLLDLASIEKEEKKNSLSSINLKDITNRVLASLQSYIKEKNLKIEQNFSVENITADEARIEQVIFNLVDNAIKYNKLNGNISISAEEKQNSIEYKVSDSGIGIPKDDQERLFERFYRVDKARSRKIGGTGLGLAIVKNIIKSHNGDVFVKSQLEQGSTIGFTLPVTT